MTTPTIPPMDTWWERWLTPDRPGLRQFILVALALILPLPALLLGPESVLPALAAGSVLGLGLGLGWSLALARSWFRQAPVTTTAVLLLAAASVLHVEMLPRWELLLRLRQTSTLLVRYAFARDTDPRAEPPPYRRGPETVATARGEGTIAVYTPLALQRWTPSGWKDGAWMVVDRAGRITIYFRHDEYVAALAARAVP